MMSAVGAGNNETEDSSMTEHATDLRGFMTIAADDGTIVGRLHAVYVEPQTRKAAAIVCRTGRIGGDKLVVDVDHIQKIGEDVVLIDQASSARDLDGRSPPGRSVKDLQGTRVTTDDGVLLGTLVDLDFASDWRVCEIALAEDKTLSVDSDDIRIADEVIVPKRYQEAVRSTASDKGVLRRILGGEAVDDTRMALRRALAPRKSKEKSAGSGRAAAE
jgi:sporulation protein YlmC with PRC-barrel domain